MNQNGLPKLVSIFFSLYTSFCSYNTSAKWSFNPTCQANLTRF